MELDLSTIKKIFFVGIGGIGISALAKMALSRGIEVSGVNDEKSGATLDALAASGVNVIFQDGLDAIPEADLYVYSDAWLYRGPDILENAKKTGKPVLSYFQALGAFAKEYRVIAVAGVHGKTTTTAMIAEVLIDAGLDPTVIVGSFVKKFDSNFRQGNGEWLVVEADEYMRHFLNFNPEITIITNIEADHLDYYKDLADVENAFTSLISQTTKLLVCDPVNTSVARTLKENKIEIADYTKFTDGLPKLSVPGEHNRKNAACAFAVAQYLSVPKEVAEKALVGFQGTWRRLEKRGMGKDGTIIYDDYAHHPTEIRASLEALRELYPKGQKKITVLFQPHLYSRTKALFDDFAQAFGDADAVYFLPIYFAREDPDPTVSSEKLAMEVSKHVSNARAFSDFIEAEQFFKQAALGPDDIFVTMGAGESYKIGDSLLGEK